MAPHRHPADGLLTKSSQARLSELLNILVQASKTIHDEYDGIMGPDGQGWNDLLDVVFPNSSSSPNQTQRINTAAIKATATDTALPRPTDTGAGVVNHPPLSDAASSPIPGAATTAALTPEQRNAEWRVMMKYSDVRTKIHPDELARAHAAFVRWWGWAPTKEQMQRAREAARASWVILGTYGPWCSPYATAVWNKANRDQVIARIRELKKTDWEKASELAAFVGVVLKQSDKPKNQDTRPSLIVRLKTKAGSLFTTGNAQQPVPCQAQVQADEPVITTDQLQQLPGLPMPHFGANNDSSVDRMLQDGSNYPPYGVDAADDDADPNMQLHREMLLHSQRSQTSTGRAMVTDKQEVADELDIPDAVEQHQPDDLPPINSAPQATVPMSRSVQAPAAKPKTKKPDTKKPTAGTTYYNYAADMTPDPRVNGLIAYVLGFYRVEHKKEISTSAAALEKLLAHATAALPALLQNSQASMSTRGLFRWDEKEIKWELTLERLDGWVQWRAQSKKKTQGLSGPSSLTDTSRPKTATPNKQPKPIRAPYPEASVVTISNLTPDCRVNAFAAYLARGFYKSNGIDLMANADSKRKLMMYSHRNERRLHGNNVVSVNEMNFWEDCDLEWSMKGFQLDTLEDEWKKRFPPPEDSESEAADEGDGGGHERDSDSKEKDHEEQDGTQGENNVQVKEKEQEDLGEHDKQEEGDRQEKGDKRDEDNTQKANCSARNSPPSSPVAAAGLKRSRSSSLSTPPSSPDDDTRAPKMPRLSHSKSPVSSPTASSYALSSSSLTPQPAAWLPSPASPAQLAPDSPGRTASLPRESSPPANTLSDPSPTPPGPSVQEVGQGTLAESRGDVETSHGVEHTGTGDGEAGAGLEHGARPVQEAENRHGVDEHAVVADGEAGPGLEHGAYPMPVLEQPWYWPALYWPGPM